MDQNRPSRTRQGSNDLIKTLIIGGGLSGLSIASAMQAKGEDYLLLEARDRFGGRILSQQYNGAYFDMGPAWFWPDQPRIAALVKQLGLKKFDQYSGGYSIYENERGEIQRAENFASMQGSWRLANGLSSLTDRLAQTIPDSKKRLNIAVVQLQKQGGHIVATCTDGTKIQAHNVVLTLPPRVASKLLFEPALPDEAMQAMNAIPTWMAGQAKGLAVYETPFWREAGFSGDAVSHVGPLVEMHDASPAQGGPYALFGFIGVAPEARENEALLREQIHHQLERIYGPNAAKPRALYLKDWAQDPHTSVDADKKPLYSHPRYGLPQQLSELWQGSLHFAGTEVAPQFGGYIEGALEASEIAFQKLARE